MITITDGQTDIILDDITEDAFWDDKHYKSLKESLETFDFTTFADKPFSEHLVKKNRVIIPGEDGEFIEFIIQNTRKYRDINGGLFIDVYTSASYIELRTAKVIYPQTLQGATAKSAAEFAVAGTEWQVGQVDYAGIRTMPIENHTNPYSLLKQIASKFGLELRFRIEHDGNQITGRYVDLIERVGDWKGREVEFGKDLLGIERKEDTSNVVTALVGLGPEREDGTRLEVFVEDKEALARWSRNGQHIIDIYEPESTDTEMTESRLRELTQNELEKRVNSVVEYVGDIADFEKVPGLEHEKIRFGDTIKIKDTGFNPPLYLEARVHTQERSIKKSGRKTVVLGDYIEYTEEEVKAIWRSLQAQIAKKISMADVLEVTYTKAEIDEKDIPGKEAKAKIDRDVGEAIIETTDGSQDKADQAERNAKDYANNVANQVRQEAITEAVNQAQQALHDAVNELETSIAEKANAEWVNEQLQLKADSETVSLIQNTVDELQDTASSLQQAVDNHADQLEEQGGKITKLETDYDELEGSLNATITELSNLNETVSRHETQIEANAREIALKASQQEFNSLSGTVSDISGQLTVMAGQIEAKAEKSELEELEDDVSQINTELSSLKVNVEGISTNVSNLSQTVTNHGTQISSINSSITQLSGEIESKVDKTEYETDKNGIISRLNSAETRISQTEDEIEARVTKTEYQQDKQELEGDISQLATRMSTAETNIQANATAISLKANAADVYTKSQVDQALGKKVDTTVYNQKIGELTTSIDGISANVSNLQTTVGQHGASISNLQSQVNIQAGQIASKVDATYVDSAIEAVEIGGRNYFVVKDALENTILRWADGTEGPETGSLTSGFISCAPLERFICNFVNQQTFYYNSNKEYIGATDSRIGVIPENADNLTVKPSTMPDDNIPAYVRIVFRDNFLNGKTKEEIKIMLEKGNKATDWTPAPEDVQAEINGVYSYASSEIQQLAGQVSTKAEASTVTELGSRVTTAEQTIDALSGQIASKVSRTEFENGLNKVGRWTKQYRVNTDNPLPLTEFDGSPLDDLYTYEVTAKVAGTSTNTTAIAIFKSNKAGTNISGGSGWTLEKIYELGTTSNHPEFFIDEQGRPSIRLYGHSQFYEVVVTHEKVVGRQNSSTVLGTRLTTVSSEIQQLAGEVRTKAEASTVTALGNRVTTAEQNISALQGEITQKVSQSTFNALENRVTQAESRITQTANNVTVAFSRIDSIDGVLNSAVTTIDASGVTVKDGSFYLEDDTSDTKYSIVPKTNLLDDHSFEMVERTGSVNTTYGDFAVKPQIESFGRWRTVGSPRLLSAYQTDWVEFSLLFFGLQAIVVSNSNYVEQHFPYIPGKTYTVSAYFTGSSRSASGVPRIDVRLQQSVTGEVKKTWTKSFPSVTDGQKPTRYSLTFTVPANADNSLGGDIVVVSIRANSGWVVADGVQVVEGETPTLYDPENSIWALLRGVTKYGFSSLYVDGEINSVYVNRIWGNANNEKYVSFYNSVDGTEDAFLGVVGNGDFVLRHKKGPLRLQSGTTRIFFNFNNSTGNTLTFEGGMIRNITGNGNLSLSSGDGAGILMLRSPTREIRMLIGNDGLRVANLAYNGYRPVYASGFQNMSTRDLKKDIKPFDKDGVEIINSASIKTYRYKEEDEDIKKHIGLIFDEAPPEITQQEGAIDLYAMCSVAWKAIQELSQKIKSLEEKIEGVKK